MKRALLGTGGTLVGVMLAIAPALAAPISFFGQDLNGDPDAVLGTVTSSATIPNSFGAQTSFLSGLVGVGTETFTSFAGGATPPFNLVFPGAGTATLASTAGSVTSLPAGATNGAGRYGISGANPEQYFDTDVSNFTVSFSSPIAAFGFFGIDVGDFGGHLSVQLTPTGGGAPVLLDVGNSTGTGTGSPQDGSVLYFGFIDPSGTYSQVTFFNTDTTDVFGFDNMTVGSLEQVNLPPVSPVPEPATLLLLGSTFATLGGAMWRRARRR